METKWIVRDYIRVIEGLLGGFVWSYSNSKTPTALPVNIPSAHHTTVGFANMRGVRVSNIMGSWESLHTTRQQPERSAMLFPHVWQ